MDPNPVNFDATVAVGTSWTLVHVFKLGGGRSGGLLDLINTGAADLTNLKLTRTGVPSGHAQGVQMDFMVDADFNAEDTTELTDVITGTSPANIHLLASAAKGQIKLDFLLGVQELGLWAKSAGTTLRARGGFYAE